MSFQINSIGNTSMMTISSLSFQLENTANCLYVGNGLSIYQPKLSNTSFQLGCMVPINYNQYGLKIFPNPIGNNPKIQFLQPSLASTMFTIRCYNVEGKLVFETSRNGQALSTGVILNTSRLFAGNYVIQVLSDNSVDLIQVIKQD